MAQKKEVLRYEAEISDAEQKIGKLGEVEEAALGKGKKKSEEAASATEDLTKQKEKLGAAVRMTGAQFGGAVGDIGNLVELMQTGSKAAIGFGAALAGLLIRP